MMTTNRLVPLNGGLDEDFRDLITRPWVWHDFGGGYDLVTATGGSRVILCRIGGRNEHPAIGARVPEGFLKPITPEFPIARVLTTVPKMVEILRDLYVMDDRPRQRPLIGAVLEESGLI